MFGFLYEMMRGSHGELPRRRHADPVDAGGRQFLLEEPPAIGDGSWMGRGEVPGQRVAADPTEGQSVADETRRLISDGSTPTVHPAATVRPLPGRSTGRS